MIYYSVIPAEAALHDPEQEPETQLVEVDGVPMMVEMDGPRAGRIQRLLSTDPQHYLDTRYQPGTPVQIQP
ncbi:YlzJ-like family protein [Melghirimyces algeriensis]|uniref:YlzJ-like protein n=1 Tax=Melghirimyces algeriensis TaxID=910412 RepID=A0A521C7I9_9BACL|nr:YlzJ-like family protein [Melghirimyces algeriensis]SMO55447.1 YlzJ-like protein [Melghirimyces algeriensis]